MPKALSDDLRCRILQAYLRREGSQAELSRRFGVSFEYVRKIRGLPDVLYQREC
jgi:hypothetical protein